MAGHVFSWCEVRCKMTRSLSKEDCTTSSGVTFFSGQGRQDQVTLVNGTPTPSQGCKLFCRVQCRSNVLQCAYLYLNISQYPCIRQLIVCFWDLCFHMIDISFIIIKSAQTKTLYDHTWKKKHWNVFFLYRGKLSYYMLCHTRFQLYLTDIFIRHKHMWISVIYLTGHIASQLMPRV